jgi:transmembrane sensor
VNHSDPNSSEIARLRAASEWVQRLNEPDAEVLVDEWLRWCESDPLNLPAFEKIQRLWNAFPARSDRAATSELPAAGGLSAAGDLPSPSTRPANARQPRGKLFALAASVALLGGLGGWLALRYPQVRVLGTPVGEQRRVTLADGSHMDLAPDSRVSARFTSAQRDVQLERGQAFFEVAPDSARPFVVHVDSMSVTAIGTAFDVRTGPGNTVVTVSEGVVNVAPGPDERGDHSGNGSGTGWGTDTQPVRARVGQRLTFSKSAHRLTLAAVDPATAGSWRGGTLQFMGEPLVDVVGAINRYRAPRIVVAPELQQTRFTGTVSPSDVRDWLKALEKIYAVEVVDQGTDGILIRARIYNVARN